MTGKPLGEQSSNGTPVSPRSHLTPIPPPTASSLNSQRPQSGVSVVSSSNERYHREHLEGAAVRKSHSHSVSSKPRTLASSSSRRSKDSASADNRDRQRAVRTLPRKKSHVLQWKKAVSNTLQHGSSPPTKTKMPNLRPTSSQEPPPASDPPRTITCPRQKPTQ